MIAVIGGDGDVDDVRRAQRACADTDFRRNRILDAIHRPADDAALRRKRLQNAPHLIGQHVVRRVRVRRLDERYRRDVPIAFVPVGAGCVPAGGIQHLLRVQPMRHHRADTADMVAGDAVAHAAEAADVHGVVLPWRKTCRSVVSSLETV